MASPSYIATPICLGLVLSTVAYPDIGGAQTNNPQLDTAPEQTGAPPESPPGTNTGPTQSAPAQPSVSPFGPKPGVFPTLAPPALPPAGQAVAPGRGPSNIFPGPTPEPAAPMSPSSQPAIPLGAAQQTPQPATPGAPEGPAASATAAPLPNTIAANPASPVPAAPPPLTPVYGYGTPNPPVPGSTAVIAAPPPAPPSYTNLPPLAPGALPIQANDLRAPPVLITPSIGLFEGYTDNPRNTAQTFSDSTTHLNSALNISVDTVRFQGQISNELSYYKYARASDQDSLNDNLAAFGLATVVPEHLFVDGRAAITQLSRTGGVGFANATNILPSEQTQALTTSLSPILRTSFGDALDGELRYIYALNLFSNGTLLNNTPVATPASTLPALSNTAQNEVTLSLATGRAFSSFGSKLTLDALRIDSQSAARSSQARGYDDLEYAITPRIAVLGRIGFEDIRYPLQPAATTVGPIWLLGGRIAPAPGNYLAIRYGLQDGFYGPNAEFRYQLTARTNILASYETGLGTSQEQIQSALSTSQLSTNGTIVNQFTGLPSALSNPEFAYSSNNVFRLKEGRVAIQTALDRDTLTLMGLYDKRTAFATTTGPSLSGVSGSDTTFGVNFTWSRSVTPALTSYAGLGYSRSVASDQNTFSADWRLTYSLSDNLQASLEYQLINVTGNGGSASAFTGIITTNYTRNIVEVGLQRSF